MTQPHHKPAMRLLQTNGPPLQHNRDNPDVITAYGALCTFEPHHLKTGKLLITTLWLRLLVVPCPPTTKRSANHTHNSASTPGAQHLCMVESCTRQGMEVVVY